VPAGGIRIAARIVVRLEDIYRGLASGGEGGGTHAVGQGQKIER